MDYVPHLRREIQAFEAAARAAAGEAPLVPSCPRWSMSDLVLHLGGVHRGVTHIIDRRLTAPPDFTDPALFALPEDRDGWPGLEPVREPKRGPIPASLLDWFTGGAATLVALFGERRADETVWTWSSEQTVGFWLRMQAIEAAVHQWDAENAVGAALPVDAELAADAVGQNFEVMAPARRGWRKAPPGAGERYRFRRTDGPGCWTVCFDGDEVVARTGDQPGDQSGDGGWDVELAGTASELMLFLWQRVPADRLTVTGERDLVERYFTLVPPM